MTFFALYVGLVVVACTVDVVLGVWLFMFLFFGCGGWDGILL